MRTEWANSYEHLPAPCLSISGPRSEFLCSHSRQSLPIQPSGRTPQYWASHVSGFVSPDLFDLLLQHRTAVTIMLTVLSVQVRIVMKPEKQTDSNISKSIYLIISQISSGLPFHFVRICSGVLIIWSLGSCWWIIFSLYHILLAHWGPSILYTAHRRYLIHLY